jgi:hypothetical protein
MGKGGDDARLQDVPLLGPNWVPTSMTVAGVVVVIFIVLGVVAVVVVDKWSPIRHGNSLEITCEKYGWSWGNVSVRIVLISVAGSRKCELPRCTMVWKFSVR